MRVLSVRIYAGPNIYSYRPVLKAEIDIQPYADVPSRDIPGLADGLFAALPGLIEHRCSLGRPGGFAERLAEGTYLAHIFEHVVLELQTMAGRPAGFGRARATARPGVYTVVAGYSSAAAAGQAVVEAEALLQALLDGRTYDAAAAVDRIRQAAEREDLGPSTAAIRDAALARGIPVQRVPGEDLLILGYGARQERVWATITSRTSVLAADLAADKHLTKKLLAAAGIPVPEGVVVSSAAEAVFALAQFGGPVAVKPLGANQGKGVSLGITSAKEMERAFHLASAFDSASRVIVEECLSGRQYRICVVGGRMAAAAERIPAYCIGDGRRSIAEIVAAINADPRRGEGHERPLTKIRLDAVALTVLAKQGLTPAAVPENGRIVYIRENANLSTGGTAVDVTDIVNPETVRLAERAAQVIGLDVAGVDLVAEDITKPLGRGNGAVIEVNAAPGIRMHHYPSAGKPRPVAARIVDYLFPGNDNGRIPIVAVTGTNGKTTVVRMVGHILEQAGQAVGLTSTDGVFINGRCVQDGDTTGPASARMVLSDPGVGVAVLEVARGGIVRGGLGYDHSDVAVITNITEDHFGQDGIEDLDDLAHIKSLVTETVRPGGFALLNADDRFVAVLASRAKGEIVYFSSAPDNIIVRRQLGAGGKAFFVKEGYIYAACGRLARRIVRVADIPVTLGGIAQHNVQNAAAAAAAAYCLGVPVGAIRKGLATFDRNPGRLTLADVGDFRVCIDYGHNPAGYRALIATARRMGAKRLVGVIGAPGDRRDDVIISVGRSAGQGFDFIYIKEDGDLRGRQPGETAELLRQGVLETGFPAEKTVVVLDEAAAVAAALAGARPGDLVVVFYEKFDRVMGVVEKFQAEFQRQDAAPAGDGKEAVPVPAAVGLQQ